MEIDISKVYGDLMYVAGYVGQREFSGNLFAERQNDRIIVYDFILLDVGSYGYTQIKPELMLPLLERPDIGKLKGWVHRHPIGNGVPGAHNWSGTDEKNIKETPLGSLPELVRWSFSIVLTPYGWVGRVDNYITGKTLHCPVVYFRPETAAKAHLLAPRDLKRLDRQILSGHFGCYRYNQLYFGEDGKFYSLTPEEVELLLSEEVRDENQAFKMPAILPDLEMMKAFDLEEGFDDNWMLPNEDWDEEQFLSQPDPFLPE